MKISITFKDPDVVGDAIDEAVRASLKELGLPKEEQDAVFDVRRESVNEKLDKWISHGEYVTVEFDTDAGTATVKERG